MQPIQYISLFLLGLVLGQAFALPEHPVYVPQLHGSQIKIEERKFAEKSNAIKKVAINNDSDQTRTTSIQENGVGNLWSNVVSMLMQMLLGQSMGIVGPSKNDIDDGAPASPWANVLSVGLRVLTTLLGGPQQAVDGIDKVDNQSNPMEGILTVVLGALLGQGRNPDQVATIAKQASEFISIVINLLDALKTSFSQRSLTARSLGQKDTMSEVAIASITMLKGYVRSMKSFESYGKAEEEGQRGCAERALCETSAECVADTQGTSIFCQLGSYATSYFLQQQSGVGFEALYEAGRRGRSGEDCRTLFLDCNAV